MVRNRIRYFLLFMMMSVTAFAQLELEHFELKEEGHESYLLVFSPDSRLLASVDAKNEIVIWDVVSKSSVNRLNGHKDKVSAMAFSHDGQFLFSGDKDGTLVVWKVGAGIEDRRFQNTKATITSVDITEDNKFLLVSDVDGNIIKYDVPKEFAPKIWQGHNKIISDLRLFQQDKYFITSGYDGEIKIWITETNELFKRFNPDAGKIYSMTVSRDGNLISSSTDKKNIIIYDFSTGYQYAELDLHKKKLVLDHEFSVDSKYLFTIGLDNQLRIYNDSTKTEVFSFKDFYKAIRVTSSMDGKFLAVSDVSTSIKVFNTEPLGIKRQKTRASTISLASSNNYWDNDIKIELIQPRLEDDTVLITAKKEYTLKGKIESGNAIYELYVNDMEIRQDENGYFETDIRIPYGDYEFKILAKDVKDNVGIKSFYTKRLLDADQALSSTRVGRDYALIVGTNEYDSWGNLGNPVFDATTISEELETNYNFKMDLVLNPTRIEFLEKIREYTKMEFAEEDQLFIFIAGHGQYDDLFKEGYIVNKDSKLDDEVKESYLSYSNFRNIVNNIPCKHVMLVLDVCFGGTFNPVVAQRGAPMYDDLEREAFIKTKLKYTTRKYITSGGKQYVPDGIPGHHSPFARRLIEGLRGDGLGDNILTFNELLTYVERVKPDPNYGEFGQNEPGSDFLFIKN